LGGGRLLDKPLGLTQKPTRKIRSRINHALSPQLIPEIPSEEEVSDDLIFPKRGLRQRDQLLRRSVAASSTSSSSPAKEATEEQPSAKHDER